MVFAPPQPAPQDPWRLQLDRFATLHDLELAALAWELWNHRPSENHCLGIDLKPTPHFVYYTKQALDKLNKNTGKHLQEILGLVDGYNPEEEVMILAIGDGQVKLIHYQPDPLPPDCASQVEKDPAALVEHLETRLTEMMADT